MRGNTRHVVACAIMFACACGTGDTRVDPGDLELRDLLGVAPETAASWDVDQRASARRVLLDHLDDEPAVSIELRDADTDLARSLAKLDARRFADGDGALGLVVVSDATVSERRAPSVAKHVLAAVDMQLSERWGALDAKSEAVLAELAVDAGYTTGKIEVAPEPQLAVIAAYAGGRLVVNPVLLAAFDPDVVALPRTTGGVASPVTPKVATANPAAGNPYSFYGSVAECAYAQRLRCESCLPNSSCQPTTNTTDGNFECTTLAADDGRGYFLYCINLALAITSVEQCTADDAPGCARVTDAASDLGRLDANASFVTDAACASGLDGCLAKIYGPPPAPFPGIVDGGTAPPPTQPPRDTDISCGDSCSDNNTNCDASPSCDCSGPSCNNSLSCDSTCSNSNSQSGCGACDSCDSDSSSGGGGGGGGGDCGGNSGGGGTSSGGGCGGCSDSGSSSSCGGGSCGGGGDSSSSCGSSGGGGGCQITRREPSPIFAVGLSLTWAFLPVPLAALMRRRSRKPSSKETP